VLKSRKLCRQLLGIWTVVRSSTDSSVAVPIKLKDRQPQASFNNQFISSCWSMEKNINQRVTTGVACKWRGLHQYIIMAQGYQQTESCACQGVGRESTAGDYSSFPFYYKASDFTGWSRKTYVRIIFFTLFLELTVNY